MDIPALTQGIDTAAPSRRRSSARRSWRPRPGARGAWFLINGASQGNHAACLALAQAGERRGRAAQRALEHDRRPDPLRAAPGVRRARSSIPSSASPTASTPEALDGALAATPGAAGAIVVSPTYFGAVADVRGLSEVAHAPRRAARRRRGLGRAPRLPRGASRARALARAPTSSCRARTRSSGASRSRRCCTSAPSSEGRLDEQVVDRARDAGRVDQPELAAARARSTPRAATPRRHGPRAARGDDRGRSRERARGDPRDRRASTCSTSGSPAGRACTATTRCGWPSTCAARGASGYQVARAHARAATTSTSSWPARTVIVAVFGMGETAAPSRGSGWSRRCAARSSELGARRRRPHRERSRRRRPGGRSR